MKQDNISIYEIKLSNCWNKNYLMFIPSVYISVGLFSFSMSVKWFRVELVIYIWPKGLQKTIDFAIIPHFVLYRNGKNFKEKWDFQFYWLWMCYRKFFGERKAYDESLRNKVREFKTFWFNKKR